MKLHLPALVVAAFAASASHATDFYWNGTGSINAAASWGTSTNGSGTHPSNFSAAGQTFNIQSGQTALLTGTWTISGSGSKLLVQSGGTFNANGNNATTTVDLNSGATYIATSTFSNLTFGTIGAGSTFNYQGTSGGFQTGQTYGGLTWNSSTATATPGTFATSGNFTVASNTVQVVSSTSSSNTWTIGGDVAINSSTTLSLAQSSVNSTGNPTLNIAGGLTNNTGGTLLRGASAVGSALINFNGTGSSNVTWGTHSGVFNVTIGSGKTITFLDNLSDSSGTLTVNGTLTTSSAKTATVGTTVLTGGTIGGAGTISAGSYDVRSGSVSGKLSGSGAVAKTTSGTVTLTGSGNDYTGGSTISGGTLSFANGSLGTSGAVTMNGGTLQWNGSNTQDISSRLTMVNATNAIFDTNGNNVTFSQGIGSSSSGSLVKNGAGKLTLSGAGSYSGGTTVGAGTLTVANNTALGSAAAAITGGTLAINTGITVANNIAVGTSGTLSGAGSAKLNGTVTGTGTLSGALTFGSGGNISPGNSPGILKVDGSLTFNSGSTYTWELNSFTDSVTGGIIGIPGTDFDQIQLLTGGSLTASAASLLPTFTGTATAPSAGTSFWQSAHSWTVIATAGGTITSTFAATNSWSSAGTFNLSGGTLSWAPTAIPEPSAYAAVLATAALACAAWRRRQRPPTA